MNIKKRYKVNMAALIFLMLLLLATAGCAGKTEADKIHEISLPNEDIVVMQMKSMKSKGF